MSEHSCPIDGCTLQVDSSRLMCGKHWWMVPEGVRREVWRQYRRNPGGRGHTQAINDAIASVKRQERWNRGRAQPELPL